MELHFLLISDVLPFFKFRQHGTELLTVQKSARVLLQRDCLSTDRLVRKGEE
jgi:hypothetical protein